MAKNQGNINEEFSTHEIFPSPPSNHEKGSSKCIIYILVLLVVLSIAALVFGHIAVHINTPSLRLSNVAVKNLRYGWASINMTLIAELRLHNMNFGRFEFHHGSTTLLYKTATIGATDIHGGGVGIKEDTNINATMKVITASSGELSKNYTDISRDIELGLVKLRILAKLEGEVRVVKIISRHKTPVLDCTMGLNLRSQVIQGLSC